MPPGKRDQVGEVEVEGQDNAALGDRFLENLVVRRPLETFVAKVDGIVPLGLEPLHDSNVHAHVGEEPLRCALRDADFFLREPGRVFQRLLDVFPLEVRRTAPSVSC